MVRAVIYLIPTIYICIYLHMLAYQSTHTPCPNYFIQLYVIILLQLLMCHFNKDKLFYFILYVIFYLNELSQCNWGIGMCGFKILPQ